MAQRAIAPTEDPVCGMTVDLAESRGRGLTTQYDGREFGFCGRGCLLEFKDDPARFLAEDHVPEM